MSQVFQRTIEDFICGHCGRKVRGNGYTNHCPECLYSRHVDINPGDRQAACGGIMKPLRLEIKGREWIILHRCTVCGFQRKNKAAADDNREALIALSGK